MFLVALTVLEILAVLEAELAAADEQQRIVARQMERAGCRAEQERGVIEHVALTAGLGRGLEPTGKAAEFLIDEATVNAEVFVATGLLHLMRQPVRGLEAHGAREIIADAHAVFTAELVGGHARGVCLEREINQLVHGAQEIARILGCDVELEMVGVHLGQRNVQPTLGLGDAHLGVAHGLQILGERLLIALGKRPVERPSVLQQIIQRTLAQGETTRGVRAALYKEHVKNALGLVLGGDGPALGVVRKSVGAARRAGAAIGGHHERGMARVFAGVRSKHLIERNAVVIIAIGTGVRRGDKLVGIGVAMHTAQRGIRQAGEHGQFIAQRRERFHALGELKILATTVREPAPVLERRILLQRHRHAIGQIKTGQAFSLLGLAGGARNRRKRFQPRQRQRNTGAAQEFPSIEGR